MNKANFQGTLGDHSVNLYRLTNSNGLTASITNYGARLIALRTPDHEGNFDNIIAGPSSMEGLLNTVEKYFGAVIGRYANRIAEGRLILDGKEYQLPSNEGPHHLHGGPGGFHRVVWGADQMNDQTLNLSYRSVDGEGDYPGNLGMKVTYRLTDTNELRITCRAESDERTVLNISHHAYYNLNGTKNGTSIDNHRLMINAERFTPVDTNMIPTGEVISVKNTPLDFRSLKFIGENREIDHSVMKNTRGYDHNFVLSEGGEETLHLAAQVEEPISGRYMEIYTTEPGLQFYVCKNPVPDIDSAFCLEPQHFPDSPNHPHFPSTVLDAYEKYNWEMVISFNR